MPVRATYQRIEDSYYDTPQITNTIRLHDSDAMKQRCETLEYWDGVLKTYYPCKKICELDRVYCCRNCPDCCELNPINNNVGIKTSAAAASVTTTAAATSTTSLPSIPLSYILILCALLTLILLAGALSVWLYRYRQKKYKTLQRNRDMEAAASVKTIIYKEAPRDSVSSGTSNTCCNCSILHCHDTCRRNSDDDDRKLVNPERNKSEETCFHDCYPQIPKPGQSQTIQPLECCSRLQESLQKADAKSEQHPSENFKITQHNQIKPGNHLSPSTSGKTQKESRLSYHGVDSKDNNVDKFNDEFSNEPVESLDNLPHNINVNQNNGEYYVATILPNVL